MPLSDELTPSIKPGEDFYHYVNQDWVDTHPIPDTKARIGVFEDLSDDTIEKLKTLLEIESAESESEQIRLLKRYYRAAMDEASIAAKTPDFAEKIVETVAGLHSPTDITNYILQSHSQGLELVWNPFIEPDDKDSSKYVLRFAQGGLGLPDRDYYVEKTPNFAHILEQYHLFLERLFEKLGYDNAGQRAANVISLETELAAASMTATERRDPDAMYNPLEADELSLRFPQLSWPDYFDHLGCGPRRVIVSQPKFLVKALELQTESNILRWQDYLVVHSLLPFMNKLDASYVDLQFDFYGKILSGTKTLEARYRRIIRNCLHVLPEPTGQLFVSEHFDSAAKAEISDLVARLQRAFAARIDQLDWMSPETKAKAHEKLATFLPLLGYPDRWREYSGLDITDSYAANFQALMAHEWQRVVRRIDQPVDRREWLMSPALVNAYYWPNTNGITFPAAILQPPFFDPNGDFASNYGAIGGVIGHEITHGFDDEGSKFDAHGNLRPWWTDVDRQAFEKLASSLVAQFDAYEIADGKVNGKLTLGENIADLGGLQMAYDALQSKISADGSRDAVDNFTPEQRFFIGYARAWRETMRPELTRQILVSDPHSPAIFRTNGVVRNLDAFYEAFEVTPEEALYVAPTDRVRIW